MSTIECPRCRGRGSHAHRFGVMTHERIDELGDEFMESLSSGALDETCEVCGGEGTTTTERIASENERRALYYRETGQYLD